MKYMDELAKAAYKNKWNEEKQTEAVLGALSCLVYTGSSQKERKEERRKHPQRECKIIGAILDTAEGERDDRTMDVAEPVMIAAVVSYICIVIDKYTEMEIPAVILFTFLVIIIGAIYIYRHRNGMYKNIVIRILTRELDRRNQDGRKINTLSECPLNVKVYKKNREKPEKKPEKKHEKRNKR